MEINIKNGIQKVMCLFYYSCVPNFIIERVYFSNHLCLQCTIYNLYSLCILCPFYKFFCVQFDLQEFNELINKVEYGDNFSC